MAVGIRALLCLLLLESALAQQTFTCATGNDATQCAALRDLYYATNGQSWTSKSGWSSAAAGTGTDYCTFHSVTCTGNDVTQLCVEALAAAARGERC